MRSPIVTTRVVTPSSSSANGCVPVTIAVMRGSAGVRDGGDVAANGRAEPDAPAFAGSGRIAAGISENDGVDVIDEIGGIAVRGAVGGLLG